MSESGCETPMPLPDLLAYRLGEMDAEPEAAFEEHLFGCAECSARLASLEQLANAIRLEFREGRIGSVLTAPFVQRLKDAGMRIREYQLQPGSSVNCTVGPQDDLVVAHLHAPLRDVRRLDVVFDATEGVPRRHLSDVAFDPASGEVALASSGVELRKLGVATLHATLVAVSGEEERVVGSYTFNHSPYRTQRP